MQPFHAKFPVLLLLMMFITSCAATRMVDSWHAPNQGKKYQKLLVSRVTKNHSNQKIYEDVLSAELKQRGVEAVPAHMYLKNGDTLPKGRRWKKRCRNREPKGFSACRPPTWKKGPMSSPAIWIIIQATGIPQHFHTGTCTAITEAHRPFMSPPWSPPITLPPYRCISSIQAAANWSGQLLLRVRNRPMP